MITLRWKAYYLKLCLGKCIAVWSLSWNEAENKESLQTRARDSGHVEHIHVSSQLSIRLTSNVFFGRAYYRWVFLCVIYIDIFRTGQWQLYLSKRSSCNSKLLHYCFAFTHILNGPRTNWKYSKTCFVDLDRLNILTFLFLVVISKFSKCAVKLWICCWHFTDLLFSSLQFC